jgi:uncharacterized protein (DUF2236 family)
MDQKSHVVSRHDLDSSFEKIRESIQDGGHGLFGPDTMMWRVASPLPVVPLMLVEAALLEAPHPAIAYGTMDSNSANDFVPRFHRSADAFYDWFYGDADTALRTARKIFGYHSKISGTLPEDIGQYRKGEAYSANEEEILVWVWATFIRPLKEYYELFHGALSEAEVALLYSDCCKLALLFGIDREDLPSSWDEFVSYFDGFASSSAMDLSDEFLNRSSFVSGDIQGALKERIAITWMLSIIAYRLHPNIRRQYPNLPDARRHRAVAIVTLAAVRAIWPRLPQALRESPRARTAFGRVGLKRKTSRLSDWVATLPAPYGSSFAEAGVSVHGNPIRPSA